jgi:hypothetical protein
VPGCAATNSPSLCWMPTSPDADLYKAVDAPHADPQPAFDSDVDHAPVGVEPSIQFQTQAAVAVTARKPPAVVALHLRVALRSLRLISTRATVRKPLRADPKRCKSHPPVNREVTSPRAARPERQCRLLAWGGWVPSARGSPGPYDSVSQASGHARWHVIVLSSRLVSHPTTGCTHASACAFRVCASACSLSQYKPTSFDPRLPVAGAC